MNLNARRVNSYVWLLFSRVGNKVCCCSFIYLFLWLTEKTKKNSGFDQTSAFGNLGKLIGFQAIIPLREKKKNASPILITLTRNGKNTLME